MSDTPEALSGGQLARAAGLVMAGFILSRVLGLVRGAIIGGVFGLGPEVDAYFAALRPPETLFLVVAGGALGSAFIPTFTSYLSEDKRDDAWRITNAVITLMTITLMVLAGLGIVFAGPIAEQALVRGASRNVQILTAQLMRIMLITPVIFGVSGLQMGLLNAHQRFLLPAFAPAMYNLGIIFGAVALAPTMGIYGLAWGTVIGAAAHWLVQLPGVIAIRLPFRPVIDIKHPGVREVARLMGPRVLGLAIVQLNFWVNTALASGMVVGSISALQNAFMLMLLPQGVVAQSVATAVFPTFSLQVSEGRTEELRTTLGQVLRAILFLSIPASVGMIVLRLPIVRLVLERGKFTFADSQATAWALLFFALGLVAHSLVEIITRAFYAMHDTRTPVIVGGGAMIVNVVLSLILIRVMGIPGDLAMGPFAGLALANTIATSAEALLLVILLNPRVGGLEGRRVLAGLLRVGTASAIMGGLLFALLPVIDRVGLLIGTTGAIAVGGGAFWGIAWVLGSEEARLFTKLAMTRLKLFH